MVVNAAIVAGKAVRPSTGGVSDGTVKIPTYLGTVSVRRGQCVVVISPASVTVGRRSLAWSRHKSLGCPQPQYFTVHIDSDRQVRLHLVLTAWSTVLLYG